MSEAQTLTLEEAINPEDAVRCLLRFIGEDPDRDGLRDTPNRICRALREMTSGYGEDAAVVLGRVFEEERYDEMILVRDIPFTSLCEHHLLPFSGTATVGYIPANGRVVGLSKLARVVDIFARRLQLQERLTAAIDDAIEAVLEPLGVGVVLRASHSCLSCRGARKPGAVMVTSRLLGTLRDAAARAEFLSLAGGI